MKKVYRKKMFLAVLLSGAVICRTLPSYRLAVAQEMDVYTEGLCEHHPEHTAECGYVEGVAEVSCSHEHNEACYTISQNCVYVSPGEGSSLESFTDIAEDASDLFTSLDMGVEDHACSVESGCITKELNCPHQHDESCGYTEGVAGVPCSCVCEICNSTGGKEPENKMVMDAAVPDEAVTKVQELIDALPLVEAVQSMTTEDQKLIHDAAQKAHDAYLTLSDEQKAQLTGVEKLDGLLALFSGMVNGLEVVSDVTYMENGEKKICSSATVVTVEDITWGKSGSESWYVVEGEVEIPHSVMIGGHVNLILKDECSLHVKSNSDNEAGIGVGEGMVLSIYGQTAGSGKLTATGGYYGAGIGGGRQGAGGTIKIMGGTVEATGGNYGAGIGGGWQRAGGMTEISGGTVEATGNSGAGIGGGWQGAGGTIDISGGTVTATGDGGAGIGGGWQGAGGMIKISGGTVEATGGVNGAGIGGGSDGAGETIEISGGTVMATGYTGAGIGGGWQGAGGTIDISGGTVTATGGGSGAGIGSGMKGAGGTIKISGGTVTATGDGGAGIGDGRNSTGPADSITVSGGA